VQCPNSRVALRGNGWPSRTDHGAHTEQMDTKAPQNRDTADIIGT